MADLVLVASGGGHLEQLKFLEGRIPIDAPRRWITFDTPQSRSMLAGERVTYVPYVGPRDVRGLLRNVPRAPGLVDPTRTAAVVSTGSGIALSYLPLAALRGIPTCYIESATRVFGPSVTGRALARVPGVQLFTQHDRWADQRWNFVGSVFEGFECIRRDNDRRIRPIRRIVVSLGTIRSFEFRRLVVRLIELLPNGAEVVWQTGSTNVLDLPIEARPEMPHAELLKEMAEADVVVAHAGTGIALSAFAAGICPILVPRRAAYREHVDDHQMQTARILNATGLAVVREVGSLGEGDLELAASKTVVRRAEASPFAITSLRRSA